MSSEALLVLLSLISSLLLATVLVWMTSRFLRTLRQMSQEQLAMQERQTASLAALAEQQSQLLASRTSRDFDEIRRAANPPEDPFANSATYYTGEAKQTEDERLTGVLNDDELTAIEGAGL